MTEGRTPDQGPIPERGSSRSRKKKGVAGSESDSGKPLCTRVPPRARAAIERAAEIRGWNPSHLLRVAAVERAAEILNLEGQVDFDFEGLARDLVVRLIRSFSADATAPQQPAAASPVGAAEPDRTQSPADFSDLVELLDRAARYGGRGFLEMVVDRCRRFTGGWPRPDDPVDPSDLL